MVKIKFDTHGFARYGSCPVDYLPAQEVEMPVKDVKSPTDIMFEKIFAKDSSGWPSSSIGMYLSEKTSDDVRQFIEQNLLVDHGQDSFVQDEKVRNEFKKLESSFIAECSRNRYESIEDYEKRLQSIIERQDEESFIARSQKFRQEFFEKLKNA